jgi:hypothetical protein
MDQARTRSGSTGSPPDVAAKVVTAKLRMQQGNLSSVEWFRGIGEYKIDYGPGWRIYLAKDGPGKPRRKE